MRWKSASQSEGKPETGPEQAGQGREKEWGLNS